MSEEFNIMQDSCLHWQDCSSSDQDPQQQARIWTFRSRKSNCAKIVDLEADVVNIYTGPFQKCDSKSSRVVTASGFLHVTSKTQQKLGRLITRKDAVSMLKEHEVAAEGDLVLVVKEKKSYLNYMFQEDPSSMPQTLRAILGKDAALHACALHVVAREGYNFFRDKPLYGDWKRFLTDRVGLQLQEICIERTYQYWPQTLDARLHRRLKIFRESNRRVMECSTASTIVDNILSQTLHRCDFRGSPISKDETLVVLLTVALEGRAGVISLSPHLLMHGEAGAGKTLLASLFYPAVLCSGVANDAGQLQIAGSTVILKIDNASKQFWDNTGILSSIKTMFHNTWYTKVQGFLELNAPTCAVITINSDTPVLGMTSVNDVTAWNRRFMTMHFKGEYQPPVSHQSITMELCENLFMEILERTAGCPDFINNFKTTIPDIRRMLEQLIDFVHIRVCSVEEDWLEDSVLLGTPHAQSSAKDGETGGLAHHVPTRCDDNEGSSTSRKRPYLSTLLPLDKKPAEAVRRAVGNSTASSSCNNPALPDAHGLVKRSSVQRSASMRSREKGGEVNA